MPNVGPSESIRHDDLTVRDHQLQERTWLVTAHNFKEIGEALSTYAQRFGEFAGSAQLILEGENAFLKIELVADAGIYRCCVCRRMPEVSEDDPVLCGFCHQYVCRIHWHGHERKHWRPDGEVPF